MSEQMSVEAAQTLEWLRLATRSQAVKIDALFKLLIEANVFTQEQKDAMIALLRSQAKEILDENAMQELKAEPVEQAISVKIEKQAFTIRMTGSVDKSPAADLGSGPSGGGEKGK